MTNVYLRWLVLKSGREATGGVKPDDSQHQVQQTERYAVLTRQNNTGCESTEDERVAASSAQGLSVNSPTLSLQILIKAKCSGYDV